jgi:histidinol dehydrogenase
MDLMSQAEHDEDAQSLLLAPDAAFLDAVQAALERRIATLPRAAMIRQSLERRGALVKVKDLAQACTLANRVAAEHLELSVEHPAELLPLIRHAGAIFLGRHTPEAFGDYCAGPNHVLPTSRAARFSNPLGVYEFQKRSSLIACSPAGAKALAAIAGPIADAEGLQAHAASARDRG